MAKPCSDCSTRMSSSRVLVSSSDLVSGMWVGAICWKRRSTVLTVLPVELLVTAPVCVLTVIWADAVPTASKAATAQHLAISLKSFLQLPFTAERGAGRISWGRNNRVMGTSPACELHCAKDSPVHTEKANLRTRPGTIGNGWPGLPSVLQAGPWASAWQPEKSAPARGPRAPQAPSQPHAGVELPRQGPPECLPVRSPARCSGSPGRA